MAKCEACLHRSVCEIRTCSECSGGFGCDDCEIYHSYDGKPSIENCEHFRADEAEVMRGKWVAEAYNEDIITCSKCGVTALFNGVEECKKSNYCPHCGARMDGAAE